MFLFFSMVVENAKNIIDNGTELALKAKSGEPFAFEALVKKFEKFVYTTIYFEVRNADDAYDISQEVFLKVFRSLDTFRGDSAFSSWLYRICKNAAFDFLRKDSKSKTVSISALKLDDEETDYDIPDDNRNNNPEKAYEKTELQEKVHRAIFSLSEEHREVIQLREIDGYSYDEIAKILGIEQGTVKSRIARARESLKKILSENPVL
jgi:RNA polymerase sigma factor, sigma-70 family